MTIEHGRETFYLIFQSKSKFAKLSDKTANLLKPTNYFSNQQNSTVAQKQNILLLRLQYCLQSLSNLTQNFEM